MNLGQFIEFSIFDVHDDVNTSESDTAAKPTNATNMRQIELTVLPESISNDRITTKATKEFA